MTKYRDSSDEEMPMDFDPFAKRNNMTKEERMYGVWADENEKKRENEKREAKNEQQDDSSDDDMLMRAGFNALGKASESKTTRKSKFINFVSGGIKGGTIKKDTPVVQDPSEEKEEKQDDIVTMPDENTKKKTYSLTTKKGQKETIDKDFGKFDKSGIGMKLMQKMGFKIGKGIGKHEQGMLNPIEAKLRKKGMGLGAGKGSERTKQSLIHFPVQKSGSEASDEDTEATEESKKPSRQTNRWKKSKRQKVKYELKSLNDELPFCFRKKFM